ncbi:MAG: hypothetical protein KF882_06670 [Bacteroidia bacterium]|nr:hypothetical protein [Bacteroidia bacterium]MCO5253476.1 hypothetical protein [Bacteroidota bacterium]
MNFFGHYFTDSQKGKAWYNMGLVFPDLFRDLYRKHVPERDKREYSTQALEFIKGMKSHIERDKMFHNCEYFIHAEEELKKAFYEKGIFEKIPRAWFMAHVLTELLTDKQLVIDFPEKVKVFYDDMYTTIGDEAIVDELFDNAVFKTVFLSRMRLIHHDKFIFAYANNEKIIATLWRVYERAKINVSMETQVFLTPILLEIVAGLDGSIHFDWNQYRKINL